MAMPHTRMSALLTCENIEHLDLLKGIFEQFTHLDPVTPDALAEAGLSVSEKTAERLFEISETLLREPGVKVQLYDAAGTPALWIRDNGNLWLEMVAKIIATWMQEVDYPGHFVFEFARVGSETEPFGFGGGAMSIDKTGASMIETHTAVKQLGGKGLFREGAPITMIEI